MGRRTKQRRHKDEVEEPRWFYVWKPIGGLVFMALAFSITFGVLALVPDDQPFVEPLPDGGQRFVVESMRHIAAFPVFCASCFVSIAIMGNIAFLRRKMDEERARNRPWTVGAWERSSRGEWIVVYVFIAIFAAIVGFFFVLAPCVVLLTHIHTIEVRADRFTVKSILSKRTFAANKIVDVRHSRSIGHKGVHYSIQVEVRGRRTFSNRDTGIGCPEPGSPEDERVGALFGELEAALRRAQQSG